MSSPRGAAPRDPAREAITPSPPSLGLWVLGWVQSLPTLHYSFITQLCQKNFLKLFTPAYLLVSARGGEVRRRAQLGELQLQRHARAVERHPLTRSFVKARGWKAGDRAYLGSKGGGAKPCAFVVTAFVVAQLCVHATTTWRRNSEQQLRSTAVQPPPYRGVKLRGGRGEGLAA